MRSSAKVGDIVLFPVIDWGFRFQRPQHIARQLGSRGYRVFYFSTVPQIVSNKTDYVIQGNPELGVVLVQLSSGNFHIPDFYRDNLNPDEVVGFLKSFETLCTDFDIVLPIIIIQQPFWWPLVSKMVGRHLVYDCLDYHAGFHDQPNLGLLENERNLVEKADAVVATSDRLADSFHLVKKCHVIRNGCEFDFFSKAVRVKSASSPIIGYVGAVSEWFDGQLLFQVARDRPDWQFHIYGSTVGGEIAAVRSLANVYFFGEIPYESVPSAIAHFDVCIIPFKLNLLTLATNPVKVYEYLAVGRPVVSTALPELSGMENIDVFSSDSAKKFTSHIERAIDISDQPERVKARQDWASKYDWSIRVNNLLLLFNN